tara:strand:- start:4494 stop:6716 length:2223 start_codon:yes stop_codon:yes gene_type:complete
MNFKLSVCKNYDPTKTKAYNNNKVAYGWEVQDLSWNRNKLVKLTTQCGISGNEFITGHKTKDNWKATHVLMYDFDNGLMTIDMLLDLQKRWTYNSYVFSSQNHQRQKIATGGKKVEAAHDRLRVLIPLAYPIETAADHSLIEAFLLHTINKDSEYIDKTFMHMHRYFAHGTAEVSSFVGNKEMLDWKMLPGLSTFKQKLEKEKEKKANETRGRKKKVVNINNTFRIHWSVKTKSGKKQVLKDLKEKTEILCPNCGDDPNRGTPGAINAVFDFNEYGKAFIYCSSCESRGAGVSGKGIYNMHPEDRFIQSCLERDFILFRDAEHGDLVSGVHKIDPKSGERSWGYRKMYSVLQAYEVLAMNGVPKPDFFPHFNFDLRFDIKDTITFERQFINKYVPSKYLQEPLPKKAVGMPKYIGKVLNHVMAGDPDIIKHYINDLADLIQTRRKRRTAFLLQGTEGTGKGLWFNRVLKPLIGRDYCNEMDQGPFINNFNSSLENNVLTLVNECRANFTSNRSADGAIVEKIKIAVSDSDLEIERKGKDRYNGKNNCSFMFASNRLKAVVLPLGDRRFNVAPRQENRIEFTDWWPGGNEIERLMDKELQEFTFFLRTYKVDKKSIGMVIQNRAKEIIQSLSMTNAEEFFLAIKNGDHVWLEENIQERSGYRGEDDYLDARNLLTEVKKYDKISKVNLCKLYNYIVHPGKPVTMSSFGKSAAGHLPEFKPVRINGRVERGISINWTDISAA